MKVEGDPGNYSYQLAARALAHTCPVCGTYADHVTGWRRLDGRYAHDACETGPVRGNGRVDW